MWLKEKYNKISSMHCTALPRPHTHGLDRPDGLCILALHANSPVSVRGRPACTCLLYQSSCMSHTQDEWWVRAWMHFSWPHNPAAGLLKGKCLLSTQVQTQRPVMWVKLVTRLTLELRWPTPPETSKQAYSACIFESNSYATTAGEFPWVIMQYADFSPI